MPKIKDLGINVVPETMRPVECLPWTIGPVCVPGGFTRDVCQCSVSPAPDAAAFQSTATCIPNSCGLAPDAAAFHSTARCFPNSCCIGGTYHSTATCIPNSCGPAPCGGCSHITNPCIGCTNVPTFPCANFTLTACNQFTCANITVQCPGITANCTAGSNITITITVVTTTPQQQGGGGLTRESIAQLKQQLQQQIAQLDEVAKNIGPRTAEEIDARVSSLKAELDELSQRRKDLK